MRVTRPGAGERGGHGPGGLPLSGSEGGVSESLQGHLLRANLKRKCGN